MDMWRSVFLKASMLVVMVLLCGSVLIVNAEVVLPLNWTSPTTLNLYDVFMVSASDGWAVGLGGTIIRWNGSSWSNVTSPTPYLLESVFMVSASDGWAVGSGGTIIHWDGSSWSNVTSPTTAALRSVFMVSASDGWAVGYGGTIIRWTGTVWIPEFSTAILMPLLMTLSLVVVVITKTVLKKRKTLFSFF